MTSLTVEKQGGKNGKDRLAMARESDRAPLLAWGDGRTFQHVGCPRPRVEGREKVTGRAEYTYDVRLPGQLYAKVLRSPHPHARLKRLDTSRAESLPGVRAVVSSASHPDLDWWKDGKLFDTEVRFVGDEVAAVAADSEEAAEDALRLIEVEYEPLPFAAQLADALAPGAPRVHPESERDDNLAEEPAFYQRGDAEAGFDEADAVVEGEYATAAALHNSLEPHGCVATWNGARLTLWESTQSVFDVRVADTLETQAAA